MIYFHIHLASHNRVTLKQLLPDFRTESKCDTDELFLPTDCRFLFSQADA